MVLEIHDGSTDLIGITAEPGDWSPHTVHTHYFGFQIPEHQIGAFTYIRYQPYFPLSQGGVIIFQGLDNVVHLDASYLDWQMTMPYPNVSGQTITTHNGFRVEFLEPGYRARTTYSSSNGNTWFDLVYTAVTPLVARGAVIPGENDESTVQPGGSEQFMHCVGELCLRGKRYDVDCFMPRDRSWRQNRTEERGGRHDPPIAWTPVYFPETSVAFNQVGFETLDANRVWNGELSVPEGMPDHHFSWVYTSGELRQLTHVRRWVDELHPDVPAPVRQTIEATDEAGETYLLKGEAIALASIPSWPNAGTWDSVIRWTDQDGHVGHGPCQGIWYDAFQQVIKTRRSQR